MLHDRVNKGVKRGMAGVSAFVMTIQELSGGCLAAPFCIVLPAIFSSVVTWATYPCAAGDGILGLHGSSCYPTLSESRTRRDASMMLAKQFQYQHFPSEPWRRQVEVIVENTIPCLRCPSSNHIECTAQYSADVCWEASGASFPLLEAEPIDPKALTVLAGIVALLQGSVNDDPLPSLISRPSLL
jgi:hypothetical protein